MDPQQKKRLLPSLLMMGVLALLGLGLYLFTDAQVFWSGFFAMMFFYGLIFYLGSYASGLKKSESFTDVMLAGRGIPLTVAVFTMSATWVGGGYINGTAESTQAYGLVWVQAPWGYALSLMIGGLIFAGPMRRRNYTTMLDPLQERFGKSTVTLAFIPALLGEIFWTAAILTALGTTFGTVLGLNFELSIIVSALIAIAYTSLGGLWAVALTDIVQLILLFIGLGIVLPFALDHVGGLDEVWRVYSEKKGAAGSLLPSEEALGNSYWQWWDYAFALMLGGIPWQVYFQRVLSAKDAKTARNLSFIAAGVCLVAAIPAVIIGMIGDVVPDLASWEAVGAGSGPETSAAVLPYVIRYLTHPIVATIGLGAIAAAVMSSVDSSVLSASSMASWNIYRPLFRPDVDSVGLAKVLKRSIWIIGIAATLLALQVKSVYALWFLCSDFVYCLLFPLLVTALFDKRSNSVGAVSGFLVALVLRLGGGDAVLGIDAFLPWPEIGGEEGLFPFRTVAMISGLLTIMIVSRVYDRFRPSTLEK